MATIIVSGICWSGALAVYAVRYWPVVAGAPRRQARLGTFFSGAAMAIHHASSGELIDIRPLKDKLKTTATKALFKSKHLEVSHTVLLAGNDVPPHQVAGEMTVQCLEGSVELLVAGTAQLMRAGDMICLAGGETHALKAIEDSSILITMLLHGA